MPNYSIRHRVCKCVKERGGWLFRQNKVHLTSTEMQLTRGDNQSIRL